MSDIPLQNFYQLSVVGTKRDYIVIMCVTQLKSHFWYQQLFCGMNFFSFFELV